MRQLKFHRKSKGKKSDQWLKSGSRKDALNFISEQKWIAKRKYNELKIIHDRTLKGKRG